jgi:putative SOS response-associated peptidase YedK
MEGLKFNVDLSISELLSRFLADFEDNVFEPILGGEPGYNFPVLSTFDSKNVEVMKWGIPSKKQIISSVAYKGIVKHPLFYRNIRKSRCIVPVTSFLLKDYKISLRKQKIFCLAGVFHSIESEVEGIRNAFVIITTPSNRLLSKISPEMPVILTESGIRDWIRPTSVLSHITSRLYAFPSEEMDLNGNNPYWNSSSNKSVSGHDRGKKQDNNIDLKPWWQKGG